jgi:hypothetical protein
MASASRPTSSARSTPVLASRPPQAIADAVDAIRRRSSVRERLAVRAKVSAATSPKPSTTMSSRRSWSEKNIRLAVAARPMAATMNEIRERAKSVTINRLAFLASIGRNRAAMAEVAAITMEITPSSVRSGPVGCIVTSKRASPASTAARAPRTILTARTGSRRPTPS